MSMLNGKKNLELIYWYKNCFSVKIQESKIHLYLNNNLNPSAGFFPNLGYPLILHTNNIIKCKLIIKLNNSNKKNCLKFYNGISWCKFILNENILIYDGKIKLCKKIRIGFLDEAYNTGELVFDSIELIFKDDNINKLQKTNNNFTIIKKDEISQQFKNLKITNFKQETGVTSLNCNNIPAHILHIKLGLILNVQHSFVSRCLPFQFINMHPFDIELTTQKIEYYINRLVSYYNNFNIIKTPLFYLDYHFINYCHFYKDTVCYINIFLKLKKKIPDLKILLFNKKYPPFVLEFFRTFQLYNSIYFFEERDKNKTLFENLYVGKFLINKESDYKYFDLVYPFLNNLFNTYYDDSITRTEKIYISRRLRNDKEVQKIGECNYLNRGCLNEVDVINFLKTKNYKEIWIEDYNLIEKIKLFNKCSHIICTAGAFEINYFLIKNCNITIINSPCYRSRNKEQLLKRNINEYNMFNKTTFIYTSELINRVTNLKENNEEIFKKIMNTLESYQLNDRLENNIFIPLLNSLYSGGSYPFIILLEEFKKFINELNPNC
jgi:hypothetical protein